MVSIKNNKILVWVLGIVLLGIWGEIAYQLIWGGRSPDDSNITVNTLFHEKKTAPTYSFIANVRDPFSYRPEAQATKKVVKPAVQIWVPPPLKLEGVIIKSGKRTAIIESSDGKTFFASPGDTLYGIKILSVDNAKVKYRYEKKDTSW